MNTILVVDDEPQIRRALSLNLGARAYEVLEAKTGQAAVAVVRSQRPDVVLLDLGLPDIDGLEVLQSIRPWSHAKVIVLTVRDDERSKTEAFAAGADDYITKPFDMAELADRIAAVLRRKTEPSSDPP